MSHIYIESDDFGTYLLVSCDEQGVPFYSFSGSHNYYESLSNYFYLVQKTETDYRWEKVLMIDVFPEIEKRETDFTYEEIIEYVRIPYDENNNFSQYFDYDPALYVDFRKGHKREVEIANLQVNRLIQTDYDFPGIASSFGWIAENACPIYAEADDEYDEEDEEKPNTLGEECRYNGDGTVRCKWCKQEATRFIESARDFLDDCAAIVEDPGYFTGE